MRIAWLLPLVLLGLSACVNETPPATPAATVVQPAPAVIAPAAPGTTVITRP
ncbi:MAG TPA: hypothetical protein VIZ17_00360 [Acetobacteraceae bacterium]